MMGEEAIYPCKRCKVSIAFKDVRYGNNGKDLLCPSCYSLTVKKQLVSDKLTDVKKTSSGKILKQKFICVKCRYHFTHGSEEAALRCPFCSHTEVLKDDFTAEKLLSEVTDTM
ncbi:MAG: hypothetical protein WC254_03700 [Candidatus Woesearchaeota archaeon]|jgi:DNA-directed RNA polymerase subunit RPC12/RpoP